MARYMRLDGVACAADDPKRGVWYSGPLCGLWTDDWDLLAKAGPGIPVCPHCDRPGYQTTFEEWMLGVEAFDRNHPGYAAFVAEAKHRCFHVVGGFAEAWKKAQYDASQVKLIPDPKPGEA